VKRFVLDASIVLAWCFPDENSVFAHHVADQFKHGYSALAPAFWPHEVLNALLAGERRKRIAAAQTRIFLKDLAVLPVDVEPVPPATVFSRIQSLSREHGLTAYDAAYLDLALAMELPVATLDLDLMRACRKGGAELLRS